MFHKEMHRVLHFVNWRIHWWHHYASEMEWDNNAVREGLGAYPVHQADFHLHLFISFKQAWDQPAVKAASDAAREDMQLAGTFMDD